MKITTGSSLKIQQGQATFQYLATVACTLNVITSGMHYGWTSPSLPILQDNQTSPVPVRVDQGSTIAVMPLIGALFGSLIVGTTVDILGRKRTIILSSFPFFAAWIMIAFSNSVMIFYIARFIAGMADGFVFTAAPMYIGEIASPKIRGLLGSSVSVSWILGILIINIIGSYLSITTTALVSSVLPLVAMVTFLIMPESPYYLIMRGNNEEAKKSMQKLRGLNDVDTELNRVSLAVKEQTQNSGKFLDLFTTKSNRKAVAIMMVLRAAQQLSGTTAITFYTQLIFKEAGDDISSELATIIYFAVQLLLACFCSGVVDKAGRRPLLITSIGGTSVVLFIEAVYFHYKKATHTDEMGMLTLIPVIALIGFVVIFSLGMQTIPILMLGELFPANVKAFALCLADIYFAIIATIVSKFFQIMKDSFGMHVPFYFFGACSVLGLVAITLFVPETKGKSLEEIQAYLRGEVIVDSESNIINNDLVSKLEESERKC